MGIQRRKIVYLVTEDWWFHSHWLPLAQAAIDEGYQVAVATRVTEHGDLIAATGCEVFPLSWRRRGSSVFAEAAAVRQLREVYRSWRPDVVHHLALKPVVYGSVAARLAHVPAIVNHITGLGYVFTGRDPRARIFRFVLSPILRWALAGTRSRVILENSDDRDLLVGAGIVQAYKTSIIHGVGVDLDMFPLTSPPAEPVVVLMATRMLWEKGVGEFVDAATKLQANGSDARFVLAGDSDPGNPNSIPESTLREWEANGVVEWWGHQVDMAAVFAKCHIVCFPSAYGEGVPTVLLEAASSGRPIVTTDSSGCRETVRHGVTGFLVPVRDVGELVDALQELIGDPEQRRRFGIASRRLAEAEFAIPRVVGQTIRLYRNLHP